MLGNRQDELLKKLKACLGSMKSESGTKQLTAIKNTYCISKENRQSAMLQPPKNNTLQIRNTSGYISEKYSIKQPLAPSNHNVSFPTNASISINRSIEIKKDNYRKYEKQHHKFVERPIKKYQYGLGLGIRLHEDERKPSFSKKYYESNDLKTRQQANAQNHLTARHSYQNNNQTKIINKKYREEVQERRKILQSEPIIHQRRQSPIIISERPQQVKSLPHNQSRQCKAIEKLNKITQLNQKINDRIRNIINVFEVSKP